MYQGNEFESSFAIMCRTTNQKMGETETIVRRVRNHSNNSSLAHRYGETHTVIHEKKVDATEIINAGIHTARVEQMK